MVIRTRGAGPVTVLWPGGDETTVKVPAAPQNVDPTGCGDAFVAGLCHSIVKQCHVRQIATRSLAKPDSAQHEQLLVTAVEAACAVAAACLAQRGAQHHRLDTVL